MGGGVSGQMKNLRRFGLQQMPSFACIVRHRSQAAAAAAMGKRSTMGRQIGTIRSLVVA